jgi:hypothetical protein
VCQPTAAAMQIYKIQAYSYFYIHRHFSDSWCQFVCLCWHRTLRCKERKWKHNKNMSINYWETSFSRNLVVLQDSSYFILHISASCLKRTWYVFHIPDRIPVLTPQSGRLSVPCPYTPCASDLRQAFAFFAWRPILMELSMFEFVLTCDGAVKATCTWHRRSACCVLLPERVYPCGVELISVTFSLLRYY